MVPFFSIVMPARNSENYIEAAIRSALNQSFGDFELIVSDNASTDRTVEIVEHLAKEDARITLVHHTAGGEVGRNRNYGLGHAIGKWVAFLDADDIWAPDHLAVHAEAIARKPNAAMCLSDFQRFADDVRLALPAVLEGNGFFEPLASHITSRELLPSQTEMVHLDAQRLLKLACLTYCPMNTASVSLRRAAMIHRHIGFHDNWTINEDLDCWLRMLEQGDVIGVRNVLSFYRINPTSLTSDSIRYFEGMARAHEHWMYRIWRGLDAVERRAYRTKLVGFLTSAANAHLGRGNLQLGIASYLRAIRIQPSIDNVYAFGKRLVRQCVVALKLQSLTRIAPLIAWPLM